MSRFYYQSIHIFYVQIERSIERKEKWRSTALLISSFFFLLRLIINLWLTCLSFSFADVLSKEENKIIYKQNNHGSEWRNSINICGGVFFRSDPSSFNTTIHGTLGRSLEDGEIFLLLFDAEECLPCRNFSNWADEGCAVWARTNWAFNWEFSAWKTKNRSRRSNETNTRILREHRMLDEAVWYPPVIVREVLIDVVDWEVPFPFHPVDFGELLVDDILVRTWSVHEVWIDSLNEWLNYWPSIEILVVPCPSISVPVHRFSSVYCVELEQVHLWQGCIRPLSFSRIDDGDDDDGYLGLEYSSRGRERETQTMITSLLLEWSLRIPWVEVVAVMTRHLDNYPGEPHRFVCEDHRPRRRVW